MRLDAYLDRIGYEGRPRADAATFARLHRAHVEAIPYENLDVQFGRPVTRQIAPIFDKLVGRRRGGWCYEMNGLFSWALEEIGFRVTRLAGAVHRASVGDAAIGNHLVLLVDLGGETWLADSGFGDGLVEPVPLREGPFNVAPLRCRLERIDGGWWRYHNDPRGGAPSFDFHPELGDEALLDSSCRFLQSDPTSPFVQNAVVQRWRNGAHHSLRGRVLSTIDGDGKNSGLVNDGAEYVRVLKDTFALDLPEAGVLWPAILARHAAVFGNESPVNHSLTN